MRFQQGGEGDEDATIQLTSLIDVVFLLLIFFMLTTTFADFTRRLDIELPEARAATTKEKQLKYTIEMDEKGQIALNGDVVTLDQLDQTLHRDAAAGKIKGTVLRADRRVYHGDVVRVLGVVRDAGIEEVGIAVR
jgi:biopolymer transport protein ExbD